MINISQENSLFLFIDVQEKLVNMLAKNTVAKKSEILAKVAKTLNIKTIITEQYPKGLGSTLESIKTNLPQNTIVLEKTSFDATQIEDFEKNIQEVKNIFVFGIETHICVFQTVISLLGKNFDVYVVKDACASREKEEFKTAINLMEKEGAKIITTEMVVFEMLKSSKHENFKEIQALIK
jgi:nicotinamidase-related amidase